MPATQSRIKKFFRAVQNSLGLHICIRPKPSETSESNEKLLNIFNELTVGISEVFDGKPESIDEYLQCDKVSCKIAVLSEQIGQVRILYSLWKNGYDLDPRDLLSKLQSLNFLVDCIRDDVFHAYLRLPPEEKLQILRKNKQVSAIFAVLGTLETEVSEMIKTMQPNEELMKTVKPLLKPQFNRVIYKRQAKNFNNFDSPNYKTVQYSCRKVTYREPLVDAWTDPMGQEYWDYLEDSNISVNVPPTKDLEPVHQEHQFDNLCSDAAVQVSLAPDKRNDVDFIVMTKTVAEFNRSVSSDSSSVVTDNTHDPILNSENHFDSIDPAADFSFWRMAANLIADHPVRF